MSSNKYFYTHFHSNIFKLLCISSWVNFTVVKTYLNSFNLNDLLFWKFQTLREKARFRFCCALLGVGKAQRSKAGVFLRIRTALKP